MLRLYLSHLLMKSYTTVPHTIRGIKSVPINTNPKYTPRYNSLSLVIKVRLYFDKFQMVWFIGIWGSCEGARAYPQYIKLGISLGLKKKVEIC